MTPLQELNRQELYTVLFTEMAGMMNHINYGSIGVSLTIHNGQVQKVEYTETRKARRMGVSYESV